MDVYLHSKHMCVVCYGMVEGTKSNNNMKGPPPLTGRALTNDLCSQYVKVKVKVKTTLILAIAEIKTLTLTLTLTY